MILQGAGYDNLTGMLKEHWARAPYKNIKHTKLLLQCKHTLMSYIQAPTMHTFRIPDYVFFNSQVNMFHYKNLLHSISKLLLISVHANMPSLFHYDLISANEYFEGLYYKYSCLEKVTCMSGM